MITTVMPISQALRLPTLCATRFHRATPSRVWALEPPVLPDNIAVVDYFVGLDAGTKDRLAEQTAVTSFDTEQHQWYRNDVNARADIAAFLAGKAPPKRRKLAKSEQVVTKRRRQFELAQ